MGSVVGILAVCILFVAYHAYRAPVLEPEELAPTPPVREVPSPQPEFVHAPPAEEPSAQAVEQEARVAAPAPRLLATHRHALGGPRRL